MDILLVAGLWYARVHRGPGPGWIGAGEVLELARAKHVDFIDIDSGHWPMVTKPAGLARILAAAAARA
jgi:pimeloyl-ACP methyl ester carboxylesterase